MDKVWHCGAYQGLCYVICMCTCFKHQQARGNHSFIQTIS